MIVDKCRRARTIFARAVAIVVSPFVAGCAFGEPFVHPGDCLKAGPDDQNSELIVSASAGNIQNLRRVLARASLHCAAQLQIDGACLIKVRDLKGDTLEDVAARLSRNILYLKDPNATVQPQLQRVIGSVAVNFEIKGSGALEFSAAPGKSDSGSTVKPRYEYQAELKALNASDAWFDAPDADVLTAIIDTGVVVDHEDLLGKFQRGVSVGCTTSSCDGSLKSGIDVDDHGTLAAGIMAARRTGKEDSAGVAWNTRFISIMQGPRIDEFRSSCALQAAVNRHVDIVNISWNEIPNMDRTPKKPWRVFERYVHRAQDEGILLVLAAGNENVDVDQRLLNPLRLRAPNMLGVMSFDYNANAPTRESYGFHTVQIAAPNKASVTTGAESTHSYVSTLSAGTSWAAAFVSGAAALLKSHYRAADYDFLKWRIMANATPDERLRNLNESGGVLNLVRTIFPVESSTGDLSRTHDVPIDWKTGLRPDMCTRVSIQGRWTEGETKGPWFDIVVGTPNDGSEVVPTATLASVTQDHVQLRVDCPDHILGAESQPLPLH